MPGLAQQNSPNADFGPLTPTADLPSQNLLKMKLGDLQFQQAPSSARVEICSLKLESKRGLHLPR